MFTYSTSFQVASEMQEPDAALDNVRRSVSEWITWMFGKRYGLSGKFDFSQSFTEEWNDESLSLSNKIELLANGGGIQTIDLNVPDTETENQSWSNQIVICWVPGQGEVEYSHVVEVSRTDRDVSEGDITRRTPSVVRDIIINNRCSHAGIHLQICQIIGRKDMREFIEVLTNSKRSWPVVLFTVPLGDAVSKSIRVTHPEIYDCAKRLAGAAVIAVARDKQTTIALRAAVDEKRAVYNGAVGIYLPGFDLDDTRFTEVVKLLPWEIKSIRGETGGLEQYLVDELSLRQPLHPDEGELHAQLSAKMQVELVRHESEEELIPRVSPLRRLLRWGRNLFVGSLLRRIESLEGELIDREVELEAQRDELDLEIGNLTSKVTELKRRTAEVENELSTSIAESDLLRERLSQADLRLQQEEVASEQADKLRDVVRALQADVDLAAAETTEARAELSNLKYQLQEASIELVENEAALLSLKEQNRWLNEELEVAKVTIQTAAITPRVHEDTARVKSLEKERKKLQKELKKSENELTVAREQRDEYKEHHDKISRSNREGREGLNNKIRQLENEISKLRQEKHQRTIDERPRVEITGPQSVLEALNAAAADHADVLLIFDGAFKSAKDSPYQSPKKVQDTLSTMADVAREVFENRQRGEEPGKSFSQVLQDSALDVSGESKKTMANPKLRKLRQFKTKNSDGQPIKVEMKEHVKLGNGLNDTSCLRIYFLEHREEEKLLIGYCGKHLLNLWGIKNT